MMAGRLSLVTGAATNAFILTVPLIYLTVASLIDAAIRYLTSAKRELSVISFEC